METCEERMVSRELMGKCPAFLETECTSPPISLHQRLSEMSSNINITLVAVSLTWW